MLTVSERFELLEDHISIEDNRYFNAKLKKAHKMISEQPNIFYRIENDGGTLVGIVKSQTNQNLIYASYIRADGSFGCQTQNLRSCGGLRGSVCKHILTLVATAGENDVIMNRFARWISNSRMLKPRHDVNMCSYIFEQYEVRLNIRVLGILQNNRYRYERINHQDNFPIPATIKILDSLVEGEVEIKSDGNLYNQSTTIVCVGMRTKILLKDAEELQWKCCSGCNQWFSTEAQEAFKNGDDCPSSIMGLAKKHNIHF